MIVSKLQFDGRVVSGLGSAIVVNREGWIITAAHILNDMSLFQAHKQEIESYRAECARIEGNLSLPSKAKRKLIGRLSKNPSWITKQAILWGIAPHCRLATYFGDPVADLAIGKLEPFDSALVQQYPVFKDPKEGMHTGTSLCRLGFPFHSINSTYNETLDRFVLAPGVLPVPAFPNDGIFTRTAIGTLPDGSRQVKFVETSSPGLRGQSGGPIFDAQGRIWAIQSQTHSLPLGFEPSVTKGGKEIVEHQFIHLGWGAHVEEIIRILTDHQVKFETA